MARCPTPSWGGGRTRRLQVMGGTGGLSASVGKLLARVPHLILGWGTDLSLTGNGWHWRLVRQCGGVACKGAPPHLGVENGPVACAPGSSRERPAAPMRARSASDGSELRSASLISRILTPSLALGARCVEYQVRAGAFGADKGLAMGACSPPRSRSGLVGVARGPSASRERKRRLRLRNGCPSRDLQHRRSGSGNVRTRRAHPRDGSGSGSGHSRSAPDGAT